MDNIIIRLVDMPLEVPGVTVVDPDGNYNIYLNPRGDIEKAFFHELRHIINDDFYNEDCIAQIEHRAG